MYLIADSGSTKTEWAIVTSHHTLNNETQGLNPFVQDETAILKVLNEELKPRLPQEEISSIYFYGAGCTAEKIPFMKECLRKAFPQTVLEVESDLLGAARSLLGHEWGIAAILGTGSNSCLFDGQKILQHTPSLGYILGDEGGGAFLGKCLVGDLAKGLLGPDLQATFFEETHLTTADILERVYHTPLPNRFLAGLVPFLAHHREALPIHLLIIRCFRSFFKRNIAPYQQQECPIHFIGGIANAFKEELQEAAAAEGFKLGTIKGRPMPGLLSYHDAMP